MITDINSIYVIDFEKEYTTVRGSLLRVSFELATARAMGVAVVKVIHGKRETGGVNYLGRQTRTLLRREFREGRLRMVICGEKFQRGNSMTDDLIENCPYVDLDPDLDDPSAAFTVVYI